MCGHSPKKQIGYNEFQGPLFTLSGEIIEGGVPIQSLKKKPTAVLLLEMNHGKSSVYFSSRENARKTALEISEDTGNPVTVAELVGATKGNTSAILRQVGMVWTAKADPLSVESFDGWAEDLASELEAIAVAESAGMVDSLADLFAIDYVTAGSAELEALRTGIASRLAIPPEQIARAQQIAMSEHLSGVIRSVSGAMAKQPQIRGTVGASLSLPGREIGSLMSKFQSFFVRDQYGRISQSLGRQAVEVINRGLADGLGRVELGRELKATISGGLRMRGYWQTVAANAVGHARSYSQGASMRAAGIEYFKVIAVMDDVTSDICLYLNDKVIPVGGAMSLMDKQLSVATPEEFMDAHPMASQNEDRVFQRLSDGTERDILRVVGPGQYAPSFPVSQLVDASIGLPPYHFRCRSTFVAV